MRRGAFLLCGLLAMSATGCGDDDTGSGDPDGGHDAQVVDPKAGRGGAGASGRGGQSGSGGMSGSAGTGSDAGPDGGDPTDAAMNDSSMDDDGGEDPGANTFRVPSGGGEFAFMTPSGIEVVFDFPASAGGTDITVTAVDPDDIEWGDEDLAGAFSEVLVLGPDGATFDDPIRVTFSNGSLIAFNFSDNGGVPEPLALAEDGASLLITHFSSIAIVDPEQSCQSTNGWQDTADSARCEDAGDATSYRAYTCKNHQFCYIIEAGCCVEPGSDVEDGCRTSDPEVTLRYIRTDSNGGAYPYCDAGFLAQPTVTGHSPDELIANGSDQVLTLTGTNFAEGGAIYINQDIVLETTRGSATEAYATISGTLLASAGTLSSVGYVNPTMNATGACSAANPGNCDFARKSTPVNVTIAAEQQPSANPTVTSFSPDQLTANGADQVLTLTGTNFAEGGAVYINQDIVLATTRVSATEAYATISGTLLNSAGELQGVGYVNPTASATGACASANPGNCDFANKSAPVNITIVAAQEPTPEPAVTGYAPDVLIANGEDQVLTLLGTDFAEGGAIYINQDVVLPTTRVSATEAHATIDGSLLTIAGTLQDVGYVNPSASATGACSAANPGNCDFGGKSTPVDITISAAQEPGGAPTVTGFSPDHLLANSMDQTLTLTGTNFQEGGAIFVGGDQVWWVTTWISSTEATALVDGDDWLFTPRTLGSVGYVNPTDSATGPCDSDNPGNCDWENASNTVNVPVLAAD